MARLQSSLAAHAREVAAALHAEVPLAAAVASGKEELEQLEQREACHHHPPASSGGVGGVGGGGGVGGVGGAAADEGAESPMHVD